VSEVLEGVGWNLAYLVEPQVPGTEREKTSSVAAHFLPVSWKRDEQTGR
jgi:hypothetical protein